MVGRGEEPGPVAGTDGGASAGCGGGRAGGEMAELRPAGGENQPVGAPIERDGSGTGSGGGSLSGAKPGAGGGAGGSVESGRNLSAAGAKPAGGAPRFHAE